MGSLSIWHWAIVVLVLVLLFGSKRLPDATRNLGRSLRILKSEVKEMNLDGPAAAAPQQPHPHPSQQYPAPLPQAQPHVVDQVAQPQPVQQPTVQPRPGPHDL
jgi:sec-independent protein translocase protein TatA